MVVPSVEVAELVGSCGGGSASGASAATPSAPTRAGTCNWLHMGVIAPLRLQFLASIMIEWRLCFEEFSGQLVIANAMGLCLQDNALCE